MLDKKLLQKIIEDPVRLKKVHFYTILLFNLQIHGFKNGSYDFPKIFTVDVYMCEKNYTLFRPHLEISSLTVKIS